MAWRLDEKTLELFKDGVWCGKFNGVEDARDLLAELRKLGYTRQDQEAFVMNSMRLLGGYATRVELAQRVCRKYRGINAGVLDELLASLIASGELEELVEPKEGLFGRAKKAYRTTGGSYRG